MQTVPTTSATRAARPPRPDRRVRTIVLVAVGATALAWSYTGLDASPEDVWTAPGAVWDVFARMFPPDFAGEIERGVIGKVFESVHIAWIGTIIAAVVSLPLAFLAATNAAPRWSRVPVRQLFNAIRAVPELIVAMVLLAVTGLGPWAGTLAIGIHSVGTLGKLSTEVIETSDSGPVEAIAAAGGGRISAMRWGVLPQVLPTIVAYWLFRFEINVRASAVLGLIGAGGVGAELNSQLAFRNFPAVGAVLVITVAMVVLIDLVSAAVRRRIIAGPGGRGTGGSRTQALLTDVAGTALTGT